MQILRWNVFCWGNLVASPPHPHVGLPNLWGSSFSLCFPRKQKRRLMGLAKGKGGEQGMCRLPGIHFLPWKGLKKERHLAHTHTHPSMFWNGNTEMAFGKNYKAVESFRQALSLSAWSFYHAVMKHPERKEASLIWADPETPRIHTRHSVHILA